MCVNLNKWFFNDQKEVNGLACLSCKRGFSDSSLKVLSPPVGSSPDHSSVKTGNFHMIDQAPRLNMIPEHPGVEES